MMKENWERKLFYLLTPALMGDTFSRGNAVGQAAIASRIAASVLSLRAARLSHYLGVCRSSTSVFSVTTLSPSVSVLK